MWEVCLASYTGMVGVLLAYFSFVSPWSPPFPLLLVRSHEGIYTSKSRGEGIFNQYKSFYTKPTTPTTSYCNNQIHLYTARNNTPTATLNTPTCNNQYTYCNNQHVSTTPFKHRTEQHRSVHRMAIQATASLPRAQGHLLFKSTSC